MQWKNTPTHFGALTGLYHWICAAMFIAAYPVVYYVVWFILPDKKNPLFLPILNIHWVLGITVGVLVLPRLIWRMVNRQPDPPPGSHAEHVLAHLAHWALYALMIIMPLTGYIGTGRGTDFGLFTIPSFRDTALFQWLGLNWATFEPPVDAVHHFVGKWLAWLMVLAHIAAAFYHQFVRHDGVLARMLPERHNTP